MTGSADDKDSPLTGGRMTRGVVRRGDTVRRPAGPHSPFTRRLLAHLADKGFDGAPRFLGTDDDGRDILTYIEGDVPADLSHHDDATLRAAAKLIRCYHDATIGFDDESPETVVCHNDLSPCNFVFRRGKPIALIDFDAAATGPRIRDLGYAVWLWLDIGNSDIPADEQNRRLNVFCAAYGEENLTGVLQAMLERQAAIADEGARLGNSELSGWAAGCRDWTRENLRVLSAR